MYSYIPDIVLFYDHVVNISVKGSTYHLNYVGLFPILSIWSFVEEGLVLFIQTNLTQSVDDAIDLQSYYLITSQSPVHDLTEVTHQRII